MIMSYDHMHAAGVTVITDVVTSYAVRLQHAYHHEQQCKAHIRRHVHLGVP